MLQGSFRKSIELSRGKRKLKGLLLQRHMTIAKDYQAEYKEAVRKQLQINREHLESLDKDS